MNLRRRRLCVALVAALSMGSWPHATVVLAQDYPDRAIHLVVPFPPGGPADIVARPLAERLTAEFGRPVVVDNRAGASGTIGAAFVAKSPPDGYTLLLGTSNELTMSPGLYENLPYDPRRDFTPITTVITFPNVLVVNPSLAVRSANDLVALTRTRPGRINYGTSGIGSTNHLTTELYRLSAKLSVNYVPYRGGAPALTDLIGGRIEAMFATMPSSSALVRSGQIRGLMVTDHKRWPAVPDVPDANEAGLPDVQVISWNGVLAPAGTPRAIVEKLHAAIVKVMNAKPMKDTMSSRAGEVVTTSPDRFAAILKDDFEKWLGVIRSNNIRVDN
jgi:tripartite-type tricarboxylate transporter receptor subunit TctC